MVALRKFGVGPNRVASGFIIHPHGDHFGGLPFFILDAQLVTRGATPLAIVGPPGLAARLRITREALFPESSAMEGSRSTSSSSRRAVNGVTVTPYLVRHACGAPPFALRLESGDKLKPNTPARESASRSLFFHVAPPSRFYLSWGAARVFARRA
jgi:ribonuclease BN (tRNA processing enzyme)